ncbi:MAG: hypothetical protein H0U87_09070 [Acidobacteria bacterium]|nr:hypothetical protein [Acidobacteriota bacterium]
MKKKFFALMIISAFSLNAGVGASFAALAETKTVGLAKQTSELAAQLPASDAVMTLNVGRLYSDALPLVLSGNQPLLAEITGKIDEFKTKTGFDLRQFEQIAIGVSSRKNGSNLTFEPVLLARGSFNANALLALGKTAANGKYREEKSGDRTIYIFSPQQLMQSSPKSTSSAKNTPPATLKALPPPKPMATTAIKIKTPSPFERAIERMFDSLSREVAVTAFSDNTLAIGSLARVREAVGATSLKIDDDVLNLVTRRANAVLNIGLKLPNGIADFAPDLGNDEISKNINAIRYLSGSLDAGDGSATLSVLAKTSLPEQAKSIFEQLQGFQMLGKSFLGSGGKSEDKQVFSRMIDNVKIARGDGSNEVTLDLQVPQNDINILLKPKKPADKNPSK